VKERFLNSITHELNTPLTVAIALPDALAKNRDGNLIKRQLEQLDAVRNSNRQMAGIVDAMIRTSAADIHLGLKVRAVSYSNFIESTVESLRSEIALQGIRVETSPLADDTEVSIDLDRIS
jgi:signal transduction histidine kinase